MLGELSPNDADVVAVTSRLSEFITTRAEQMTKEPEGVLKHPYVVPASPDSPLYSDTLWDWDSWLTSVAFGQVEADLGQPGKFFEYEKGTIENYLDHMSDDGVVPILLFADGRPFTRDPVDRKDPYSQNMHKPVLAQAAAMLAQRRGGDVTWALGLMDRLESFLNRYLASHVERATGLAYWQSDFAVGVDNDPSVFYRPDKSCGSIYLNCLLYRELLAFGYLLERQGRMTDSLKWRRRAAQLAESINTYCWDERDGTYYSVDLALRPVDATDWLHEGAPRTWPCLLSRVDSWSSFMPLWGGVAPQDRAERMVARLVEPRTFWANHGVRTLSALEQQYSVVASNNPSCWLGPIWGVSNYLVFCGLRRYGFDELALELARKTILLFGRDLIDNGCLHEYYHPDTGEPIMTAGFQNWNFLVLNMIASIEGRQTRSEF